MKEAFIDWNPASKSRDLLFLAENVINSYAGQGYNLTLRQLYYQLVAGGHIPNNVKQYKNLGNLINNARLAGLVDWQMIDDRIRVLANNSHWTEPGEILRSTIHSFYMDHWTDQQWHVELWCEKDAVSNILQPVCSRYDINFLANRGYSSQTAMYKSYKRFRAKIRDGKSVALIYFGDHDPSGIDMVRDITDRICMFLGTDDFKKMKIDHAALTMEQIKEYDPPENPAKFTDSRYENYVSNYGDSSWELDALKPEVLEEIARNHIWTYMDEDKWNAVDQEIEKGKEDLQKAWDKFNEGDENESS
jgi:hypothetical protein